MAGSPNTFTIFPQNWVFTAEQLASKNPRRLLKAFLSVLNRLGLRRAGGYLFVAIHGEFDEATGLFHLHLHGVADQQMLAIIDRLRKLPNFRCRRSKGDTKLRVRIGRKPLTNLPYPLTYILQSYWPRRWRGTIEGVTRRGTVRHRIPEPFHTVLLLWLDRWSLTDITLLVGLSAGPRGLERAASKLGKAKKS